MPISVMDTPVSRVLKNLRIIVPGEAPGNIGRANRC